MCNDFIATPSRSFQDGTIVCLPDSQGSFGFDFPVHDPTIRVARQQTSILTDEADTMYLCNMSTQNIAGLSWRQRGCLALNGHVGAEVAKQGNSRRNEAIATSKVWGPAGRPSAVRDGAWNRRRDTTMLPARLEKASGRPVCNLSFVFAFFGCYVWVEAHCVTTRLRLQFVVRNWYPA